MSSTTTDPFDKLATDLAAHGAHAALDQLAEQVAEDDKFHDLFDIRLMQARLKYGVPVAYSQPIDDLPEPARTQMEEAMLEACREVGRRLLDLGRLREAWMYLRPTGDRPAIAAALEKLADREDLTEDLIGLALHEGVAPELGMRLVLREFGTCRAITMFDEVMHQRPKADRQQVAALLVQNVHDELLENVRAQVTKELGQPPAETTLAQLVADRDWLFEADNYHVDTSHLSSVVRFALAMEDPAPLALAWGLTEYGRRLSPQYQFPGEEPFADTYVAHGLFFAAQLGQQVDQALEYFGQRARQTDPHESTAPAETLVALLVRLGRFGEAFETSVELLPPGLNTAGFAPNLLELARLANNYDRLVEVARQRGDLLSYAVALLAQQPATT